MVNATGIKSFQELKEAEELLEGIFRQQVIKVRIDNTFYSQKNFDNVDLNQVYSFMKNSDTFYAEYNIELFAGMYMHPKKKIILQSYFFVLGHTR